MNIVSLFAGVGGFDLGLERAGCRVVAQVERDAFANRVLDARWPAIARFDDVSTIQPSALRKSANDGRRGRVDLLCGGFPCQDLSVAGRRAGLAGERSGLFYEIVRIAQALAPTWGLFENVPGLLSSHAGRDMATVLEGLRQCWPVVGYAVLDSQYFGVPQRRRRVFFVGGPTVEGVEQILFEFESRCGDSQEGEEAGPHLAASLRSRSSRPGVNPPGRGGEDDMNIVCALTARYHADRGDSSANSKLVVAACLNSGGNSGGFSPEPGEHLVTHALTGEGFDASEDGSGRGTPLVPIAEVGAKTQMGDGRNGCGIGSEGDPMFTLQAGKQHAVGVRRLTPVECERLQGFPDGWTCLCQPLEQYDQNRCTCPDGPRYKTMGNAVTVNVIEWIGRQIMKVSR